MAKWAKGNSNPQKRKLHGINSEHMLSLTSDQTPQGSITDIHPIVNLTIPRSC